ncbi:MAG: addiction module protein [Nitrospiraceae bacterium]
MAKAIPNPPPEFDDLTVSEQIEYVQALWDRIAASQEQVTVPEWHETILSERLEAYRRNPTASRSWPEVRAELVRMLRE